ncbi:3beta-hydroxysteroid-dehydrogenase/decarboxylase [Abeliophyllum distichum]|uniref:Reticulon-like protein n=1 Tax=Abeliophyllum distichum TaxID=126358 RepID=A0ABD1RAC5_9LAMI
MVKQNGSNYDDHQLKSCVVLGGRGFIGRSLVERLLKLGNWIVRVADSTPSPQLLPSESLLSQAFSSDRASYFHVDALNKTQISEAIEGVPVVFFTDSSGSLPCDFCFCYKTIVQGAKKIVNACREYKVKRLIYNSSADVVIDSTRDILNGDESLPYPDQFQNMVSDFKAQAEALILSANDIDGLLTCALRPCNVFGPGDEKLIPLLVNVANSRWAKFIIGSGANQSDFTYVDNVAHALICAEESLNSQTVSVSGKAFFVTNLEPMKFWEFVSLVLDGLGYQRPIVNVPAWVVQYILLLMKLIRMKLNTGKIDDSVSVHYVANLSTRTRTFSCSSSRKHIGYSPVVSLEEGVALTVESFSHLARDLPFSNKSNEQSKANKLLGGGKVADILLWRDEKKTFTCFLLLVLLYYWFLLTGRTFISSAANLLLLIISVLSGYHMLPTNIYGFAIPRVSSSCFEISEVDMRESYLTMTSLWNSPSHVTRLLAQGRDWSTFLKVSAFLYFCKLIASHSLIIAIGLGLVLAFTLFFVYEQYEEEIDGIVKIVSSRARKATSLMVRKLPVPLTFILPECKPLKEKGSSQYILLESRQ